MLDAFKTWLDERTNDVSPRASSSNECAGYLTLTMEQSRWAYDTFNSLVLSKTLDAGTSALGWKQGYAVNGYCSAW